MKPLMKSSNVALITMVGSLSLLGCKTRESGQEQAAVESPPQSEPVLARNEAPPVEPAKPAVQETEEPDDQPAEPPNEEDDAPSPAKQMDEPGVDGQAKKEDKSAAAEEADEQIDLKADLKVKRFLIGTGVSGREPTGVARSFSKGKRIFAFVEVTNPEQVASEIYVSFFKDGTPAGRGIRMNIGSGARWRTWVATRRAKTLGTWHVIVRNGQRQQIARTSFEIKPGAEPDKSASDKKADKPKAKDPKAKPAAKGNKEAKPAVKTKKTKKTKPTEDKKKPAPQDVRTPPVTKKSA